MFLAIIPSISKASNIGNRVLVCSISIDVVALVSSRLRLNLIIRQLPELKIAIRRRFNVTAALLSVDPLLCI